MKKIGNARTIGELKSKLDEAISLYGTEAIWWGWDDGCIIIQGIAYIDSKCYEEEEK